MKLTCNQFEALMHFYINKELKPSLLKAFEEHLQTCKSCRDKYNTFKQVINELRNSYNVLSYKNTTSTEEGSSNISTINTHISAYADNELDINENIKLKKIIINKPQVRKKLENIYSLKELLKNAYHIDANIKITSPSKEVPLQVIPKGDLAFGKSIKDMNEEEMDQMLEDLL